MRATRDLLRRRAYMVLQCGLLLAHIQNTNTQYNLPVFNKNISRKFNHDRVAQRFDDPSVRAAVEADLAMIEAFNALIKPLEGQIEKIACQHDHNSLYLIRSVKISATLLSTDFTHFASFSECAHNRMNLLSPSQYMLASPD